MAKNRVLVVDDHAVVRKGIRALLEAEEDFQVVGEASTGRMALAEVKRLRPDFVLLDITLSDVSGLEVLTQIKAAVPDTRVIVLTMHESEDYFFRAIQAGADGYVVKAGEPGHVLAALRAIQEGGVYLYPSLAKTLVRDHLRKPGDTMEQPLSQREIEVLQLIAEGLGNKEIAKRLSISVATAQTHRNRIMQKVGLHTAVEIVRYGIRSGIIRP